MKKTLKYYRSFDHYKKIKFWFTILDYYKLFLCDNNWITIEKDIFEKLYKLLNIKVFSWMYETL